MTRFRYRAADAHGQLREGELEAHHVDDLDLRLRRLGLDLIRATPASRTPRGGRRGVPRRELINFCFHLEQCQRAGVPILESLADMRDSTPHPVLRDTLGALVDGIQGGLSLSRALERHPALFDGVFVSLVRAGEQAGQLPTVLHTLAEGLKRDDELAAFARRIAIYPAIVGTVIAAALVVALLYVVPELARLFHATGQPLPLQTRLLIGLSNLLIDHGRLLAVLALAAVAALRFALATRPDFRRWYDSAQLALPVLGEIRRKIILARFTALFAMMYGAGITIVDALAAAEGVVGNTALRAALQRIADAIGDGRRVSDAFADTPAFPPLVARMLRVGEHTGALDTALANVGYFYERDVREAIARVQASLEPALTLLLGGLLLWVMSAVLLPVYDLATRMKL